MWVILNNLNSSVFDDRSNSEYGYKLKAGDIIRFGRVRFIVRRISSQPKEDCVAEYDNSSSSEAEGESEMSGSGIYEDNNFALQRAQSIANTNIHETMDLAIHEEVDNVSNSNRNDATMVNLRQSYNSSLFFDNHNDSISVNQKDRRILVASPKSKNRSRGLNSPKKNEDTCRI